MRAPGRSLGRRTPCRASLFALTGSAKTPREEISSNVAEFSSWLLQPVAMVSEARPHESQGVVG